MYGVRHQLQDEFPDLGQTISTLKEDHPDLARMLMEYDETDKRIYGIEVMSRPVADNYIESLKRKRVHLKDRIYHALTRSNLAAV